MRFPDKEFAVWGRKAQILYGQHLWSEGGKMLVITEGEIDAMSVSQAQNHKYPVVSIPFGAGNAAKAIKANYKWVTSFDKVVLWFDNDMQGQDAAFDVASLLPKGKTFIVRSELKDANEYLKLGREDEIKILPWRAEEYRPEGILNVTAVKERALAPKTIGLPWKDTRLTAITYGRRYGELYFFGAGSGVGKTDYLTEQIAYDVDVLDEKVGVFFLEQQPVETVERVAGKLAGKQFHLPPDDGGYTDEEKLEWIERLEKKDNLFIFDHFGMSDYDRIEQYIRFMAKTQDIRIFYLDHLTALASGKDERVKLEEIMGRLGGLVKELNIILIGVSHLSTPDGTSHEEGGRVLPMHFKGSRTIIFWSAFMFGLERNTQAENKKERQWVRFRVVKDRWTGKSGGAVLHFGYDEDSGLLVPVDHGPDIQKTSRFGAVASGAGDAPDF